MDQKNKNNNRKNSIMRTLKVVLIAFIFLGAIAGFTRKNYSTHMTWDELKNMVGMTGKEWHCEQYKGVIPDEINAQIQPGDIVYMGGYQCKNPKNNVTYCVDNAAEVELVKQEEDLARHDPARIKKHASQYSIEDCKAIYALSGDDYLAICANLGLDPETGDPIGGGKTATTNTQSATPAKKATSHGVYDSLDDKAESAFVELLVEGDDNNGYIQVKADTEDAKISAKSVNATKEKSRDGRVEFLEKGDDEKYSRFLYSVTFPQIEITEGGEEIDLKATYEDIAGSQFDDMHSLSFAEQSLGATVNIKVNTDKESGQTVYVLTGTNDTDYNTLTVQQTDEEGNITFSTDTLQNFVITTTDVISVREAIAKAEAEEQERIEAEKKAEEEKKAAEEAERIKAEEEKKAEEERLAAEAEAAELQRLETEKQNKLKIGGIIAGIAVILAGTGVVIAKKRGKKDDNGKTNTDS